MLDSRKRAIHYLAQSPLLRGINEECFQWLDPPPEIIFLKAGDTLMRQNEANWDYFVLVSGRLRTFDEQDGKLLPLATILPGEGIGEIALLTGEPQSATVIARL